MRGVAGALLRYRVVAIATGFWLILACLVTYPLDHTGNEGVTRVLWTVHGWLFAVYLLAMLDLARRTGWQPLRMLLIAAGGAVPVLALLVERRVTRDVRARSLSAAA